MADDHNRMEHEVAETVQQWFRDDRETYFKRIFSKQAWFFWLLATVSLGLVWHTAIRILDGISLLGLLVGVLGLIIATATLVRIIDAPHTLNRRAKLPEQKPRS